MEIRETSKSGEYRIGDSHISQLRPVVKREGKGELRALNEAARLRDENRVRAALAVAQAAVVPELMSANEFYARLRNIDHQTWRGWMSGTAERSGKRIPSWVVSAIHEVCEEASDAYMLAFYGGRELRCG